MGFQPGINYNPAGGRQKGSAGPSLAVEVVEIRKQEFIRLLVEGASVATAAEAMNIAKGTAQSYLRDPKVREKLAELNSVLLAQLEPQLIARQRTKIEEIDELGNVALQRMRAILEDQTAHVGIVAKVAADILDRCPETSKTKKVDITSKVLNLKAEDLMQAAQAAAEVEQFQRMKEAEESAKVQDQQNLVRD